MDRPFVVLTVGDLVRGAALLLAALAAATRRARRRRPPGTSATPPTDPVSPCTAPRSVRASFEGAIAALAGVEELRRAQMERYGPLSDEMEEVFAACRRAVKEQELATLRQDVDDLLGMEVPDAR